MKVATAVKSRQSFERLYHAAMHDYLKKSDESGLQLAYELGRRALEDGIGMVELAAMYHEALGASLKCAATSDECCTTAKRLSQFFFESLAPYEMTHRGYREAQTALRHLNESLEVEARRIAHALHDEAGQLLVTVHFALENLGRDLPFELKPRLQTVRDRLSEVEQQLRRLSHELRPPMLDDIGLVPALDFMAQGVAQRSGMIIVVQGGTGSRLQPLTEIALYRSVQEALSNAAKHAQATRVNVNLQERGSNKVVCSVKDNGIGFEQPTLSTPGARRGLGLLGIQERVKALGGSLDIHSAPGSGTEILIMIPRAA